MNEFRLDFCQIIIWTRKKVVLRQMNYSNVKNCDSMNMRESNKQCHVKGLNNEMDAYIERAQVSMGPYKHVIM